MTPKSIHDYATQAQQYLAMGWLKDWQWSMLLACDAAATVVAVCEAMRALHNAARQPTGEIATIYPDGSVVLTREVER